MKLIIPGGTGQIGAILSRHFHEEGHEVIVLSRGTSRNPWCTVQWDGETLGDWVSELEGADVLINLSGKSVNCRYNARNRSEIWTSRSRSVRVLGRAFESLSSPPPLWIQASTATIYADRYDASNDEYTGIIGGMEENIPEKWRFSIDVARAWEGEFALIDLPKTRKVALRSAIMMSQSPGGAFDYLLWLVRCGLGGSSGPGRQYVSWIHYIDFINALQFVIENKSVSGPINFASPNPIPNEDFMRLLREAWGSRIALPTYEWMLEFGAPFLKTETELVLKSRRIVPQKLVDAGFVFQCPEWSGAALDLCKRWRSREET